MRILRLCVVAVLGLAACSSAPKVSKVSTVGEATDAPYDRVLVIALFESFDARRYLEKEIVNILAARGVNAVPSTTLMNTRTPATRQTFLAMVEELQSDAVLVTQLASLETTTKMKDMNPQTTYKFRPTWYYNVWSVEQTEYIEPQGLQLKHELVLASQLYSTRTREPVWAIEAKSKFKVNWDQYNDYSIFVTEATAITNRLVRDGMVR